MENLYVLIEAHKAIKEKINSTLNSLEDWFKEKIDWAKRQLSKITKKFKKQPEEPEKKKALAKAKDGIAGVISNAKKGLSSIKSGIMKNVQKCKEGVLDNLESAKAALRSIGITGSIAAADENQRMMHAAQTHNRMAAQANRTFNGF